MDSIKALHCLEILGSGVKKHSISCLFELNWRDGVFILQRIQTIRSRKLELTNRGVLISDTVFEISSIFLTSYISK
jgi:hypothetical protein